jgi:ubiquinone/menaquinone biosynthesis C-methylase UbiE
MLEAEMKALRDPEGAEVNHIIRSCKLSGKTVLEIGCGEGKLTRQYAGIPSKVVGIDPGKSDLLVAAKNISSPNSFFVRSIGESMPFPSEVFDIVIFASSL